MIKRIVKMTFRPDARQTFLDLYRSSAPRIRQSPGCLRLELLEATRPEGVFFTYSFWKDEAALEAYRRSELFQTTWSKTKALFADQPQAWTVVLQDLR